MDFDPDWLCPDAVHPTPQLDFIVRMQEWDSAEEELLLGMLGRLLFPVGRYDNWQACLMLIGVGGSGKTTITDAIINAGYSPEQIGYMSNTIEKNFPFESLVNSSVVIAADVDKDLMSNLSQTDLHKIINGERVEINIKYGSHRTLQWVAPFMLVANVVPNWQDDQGQMTRRVVYFNFSKKPTLCNSSLDAELKDPAIQVQILLRCSKVYRRLAVRYKQDGIMPNILAKYYPRCAEDGTNAVSSSKGVRVGLSARWVMPSRVRHAALLVCCLLSVPALAKPTRDDAGGLSGILSAPALNQTTRATRDADGPGGFAPAAVGARLHYIRVPKTGSSSLKPHLQACGAVRYHDHGHGCRPHDHCDAMRIHAKQPNAIVFGVIRAPCEHFDSALRHMRSRNVKVLPYGNQTTPMQLAQWLLAIRRNGCSQAIPGHCASAANGPFLDVQAFVQKIFALFPTDNKHREEKNRVMLLPQSYYVPDAPSWSRPVCYSSNRTVLTQQVNRVFADAGVRCRIRPEALESTTRNIDAHLFPQALPGPVCQLIKTELYPEDAALYDKHCTPKALRRALR
ncbi:hypothetical protein T492DRAFT_1147106 [Pavlovales sp. CCMP2436]|nr:hypothetical protein T492DRAFT_1147106 [Pavlovales sp. CCMP2436]